MRDIQLGKSPVVHLDETSVLDIGSCIVEGINIAPGRAIPDDGDPRIDHSLEGFLFTCGPDHIRHPQLIEGDAEGRKYPLHGSFSAHPATITEWTKGETQARIAADVPVQLATGGTALLQRVWTIDGPTGEVALNDAVTNTSETPQPVFLMYHMNVSAKLFDEHVQLQGNMLENGGCNWRFGEEPGSVFCVPVAADEEWAQLRLGPIAALGGKSLTVRFRTDTLPYLQMWRNQNAPADVLGIEPVSHRWVSRQELAEGGELNILQPGETRTYGLRFNIV